MWEGEAGQVRNGRAVVLCCISAFVAILREMKALVRAVHVEGVTFFLCGTGSCVV
jgi:hypothetical protein